MSSEIKRIEVGGCTRPGGTGVDMEELEANIAANRDHLSTRHIAVFFCEFYVPWDPDIVEHYQPGGMPVKFGWDGEGPVCKETTCRFHEKALEFLLEASGK